MIKQWPVKNLIISAVVVVILFFNTGCASQNTYRGFHVVYKLPAGSAAYNPPAGEPEHARIGQKVIVLPFSDDRNIDEITYVYDKELTLLFAEAFIRQSIKLGTFKSIRMAKEDNYRYKYIKTDAVALKRLLEAEGADLVIFGSIRTFNVQLEVKGENGAEFYKQSDSRSYYVPIWALTIPIYTVKTNVEGTVNGFNGKTGKFQTYNFKNENGDFDWKGTDKTTLVDPFLPEILGPMGEAVVKQIDEHAKACLTNQAVINTGIIYPEKDYIFPPKNKLVQFEDANDYANEPEWSPWLILGCTLGGLAAGIAYDVKFYNDNKMIFQSEFGGVFFMIPAIIIPGVTMIAGGLGSQLVMSLTVTDENIIKKGIERKIIPGGVYSTVEDITFRTKLAGVDF